ncbi:MAG: hypothetical protein WCE54_11790 [Ignavibacteriaceae bacterium]
MNKIFKYLFLLLLVITQACTRPIEINNSDNNIPPAVPINVGIFESFDGEIGIEWQGNSEPDLYGYNIYRRTDSTNYKLIKFTADNYIIDDSLNYNTTYFYEITAVNNSNLESSRSKEVSSTPKNIYKPYPVRNITINARNWEDTISIYLSWIPSGETDISGYNIYKSTSPSFTADSLTFIAFTKNTSYSDTSGLKLYTNYYYKVRAVDKGGLVSDEAPAATDEIYGIPRVIFPEDNAVISSFGNFLITTLKVPATYQIIVQSNEFFGEIWNNTVSTSKINDTLSIAFNSAYIYPDKYYYWRIATFSQDNSEPNSISGLYKFIIKQ